MLEILLFPVIDSKQGKYDPLLLCYEAYREFMEKSYVSAMSVQERAKYDRAYKNAKKNLVAYLIERNHGRVKSEDDVQLLCDLYYPMETVEYEMKRIERIRIQKRYASIGLENMSLYYIESLARVSRSLITYRDGVAAIRQWVDWNEHEPQMDLFHSSSVYNKIEIWNLLCRFTVPDLYIAIAAVENKLGMEALYEQKSNIALADKLLVKSLQKGMAENHLHFNVGFDYEIIWLYYTDLKFVDIERIGVWKHKDYKRLQIALFRCIAAYYLEQGKFTEGFGVWIRNNFSAELIKIIMNLYGGEYEGYVGKECQEEIFRLYNRIKSDGAIKECDYLLDQIYSQYIEYKTSSEFILLYQCYRYLKNNEADTFFARVFLQYIRLKNEYFYEISEQHVLQGLKYFQKKYHLTQKSMGTDILPTENMMVEVFRTQAKIENLRKLEIRVAPWVDGYELNHFSYVKSRKSILKQLCDQVYMILNAYRWYILEGVMGVRATWDLLKNSENRQSVLKNKGVLDYIRNSKITVPTLGITFHFIKEDYLEDICGQYCWRSICETKNYRSAYRLLRRLYMTNLAIAIEELRSSIPKLSEYIVGIDAASDENAMEPWMLASAYKEMRSHKYTKPVLEVSDSRDGFEKIQNIGFTYHVGEDFRHILSGLRHVDEVLNEFGYKAGDRLGHALALGIDIEQWVSDNEVVPMPWLEYMENLLWIWGKSVREGIELPIQLEILEDKILEAAHWLYDGQESITVKMLYTAYKKKFDIKHEDIAQGLLEKGEAKPQFCCCRNDEKCDFREVKECYNTWTADKLLMTHYCPVYEEKGSRVRAVAVSKEEMEVYKRLQEYLIHKVEHMGVYVETNPTSNLTIGDVSHISKHPIFYLNQRLARSGNRVFVTINSDDPAVFNTNIENELAYIYYAAEEQGIPKSEILEWIDQIREYGLEASFVQKEKGTEQILCEIEEILEAIKKFDF